MIRTLPKAIPLLAVAWLLPLALTARAAPAGPILPPGFRPKPVGVHALTGGKVVPRPGEMIEGATIVIRDGTIEAVGVNVTPPADARIWDVRGLTIYAGFIEPYWTVGSNAPAASSGAGGATPTAGGGVDFFGAPPQRAGQGPRYEVARVTPEHRTARSYTPDRKKIEPLRELGFTTAVVAPNQGIVRGASALVTLAEGNPNDLIVKGDVFQHVAIATLDNLAASRDDAAYPASLMGVIAVLRQSFFDARHYELDQADWTNRPSGRARPAFDPAREALAPAAAGRMRVLIEPGSALMTDRAARVARELQLDFALVASGQEWRRPQLARDTAATFIVPLDFPELPKLPEESDWEAVTLDQLRAWDWAPENPALLRQQNLSIALTTAGLSDKKHFRRNLRLALDRGLSESDALAALTTVPAALCGVLAQLGTIEPGKMANLTVVEGQGYFDPEAKVRDVWIDGRNHPITPDKEPDAAKDAPPGDDAEKARQARLDKEKKEAGLKALRLQRLARPPLTGRGPMTNPPAILIRNATIWTCGPEGILTTAHLLVADGKIQQVGLFKAELAAGTLEIDATGLHVTPGLIDCHSHTAILGAVNEATLPSTAMVRIGDVVNSETDTLYEQLAGGLTTANLLHGSANPIGGQNQVIKLREGASPEELKFDAAPPGIKFALGENVKQSNWGDKKTTRFPQARTGVRTFYVNRFTAAQHYLKEWEEYQNRDANGRTVPPPRRDLELEALGEILRGRRWIHCHSYRQDEIVAFLRTMESFGVKVATLQHVLEGYKVADEIARHGAGASCFSDWWAYKFEVYDAIPHAGSLMRERGALVSFNSDSSDLARRLHTEAAKAVKYGGTSEREALQFVTINPARQLRIDARVGSLEPGKDADFVLWSKSPLDATTICRQTWIDGKKYFDRDREAGRAAALEQERAELMGKVRKLIQLGGPPAGGTREAEKFFAEPLERRGERHHHCLDEEER